METFRTTDCHTEAPASQTKTCEHAGRSLLHVIYKTLSWRREAEKRKWIKPQPLGHASTVKQVLQRGLCLHSCINDESLCWCCADLPCSLFLLPLLFMWLLCWAQERPSVKRRAAAHQQTLPHQTEIKHVDVNNVNNINKTLLFFEDASRRLRTAQPSEPSLSRHDAVNGLTERYSRAKMSRLKLGSDHNVHSCVAENGISTAP